jgi:hypothetical protein
VNLSSAGRALALAVVGSLPLLGPDGPSSADEPEDSPVHLAGFPMPDGTWIHRHLGLVRPRHDADPAAPWAVRATGSGVYRGRHVVVYQYARPAGDEPGAALRPAYAQADFVDPTTGRLVGGADRGADAWPTPPRASEPCGGR